MAVRRALCAALAAALIVPGTVAAAAPTNFEPTTLLVMFEEGVSAASRSALHELAGATVSGHLPEVALTRVEVPASSVGMYERSALVRAVEVPRTWRLFGMPNDPLVADQWALRRIDAFDAWGLEDGKKSDVQVAVVDTGVDTLHADLEGRVVEGSDFLEVDFDTYDDHGHGTHVAGVIAANVSNRKGIAGLNQGASIIPMKTCADGGNCPLYETYAGVLDAVRRGADVINMSLGGAGPCSTIDQAVFDWVREQGVLTVVAAGNAGTKRAKNPSITPANCDFTFGVGAIDEKSNWAPFSSYGDFVDISAPGVNIWSTLPPLVSITSTHIGYGAWSGTSMACPHVAAAASLVKAKHPDWSPAQIEEKLMKSATDAGPKGRDDKFGHGILDLQAALR